MIAAAELAALRLKDFPSTNHKGLEFSQRDEVFRLLDKNGDGKISIEELMEVMEELGGSGEDAREMMQLLDSNSDGSLSTDEFDLFQKQVKHKVVRTLFPQLLSSSLLLLIFLFVRLFWRESYLIINGITCKVLMIARNLGLICIEL